jgi:hypothetical protein
MNDTVFTFMIIINLANCTCVPVLAWLDTPKAIQYFKQWEQFQVRGDSNFRSSHNKMIYIHIYTHTFICTGCFNKMFTMVFQMLLGGGCYEIVYA